MELPLLGGFNDGKFIEPKGRDNLKMARPSSHDNSVVHCESTIGFEYEIYELTEIKIYGKTLKFYGIEGISLPEVFEKLIFGYKQYNKKKSIDLVKK